MNRAVQVAMAEAGETAESLAAQVGVDPKTAARWVSHGRVPQTRHRGQIAAILRKDVSELWPDVLKRREPAWFRPWTEIEREACGLRWYESAVLPGLLQTEEYACAVLASGPLMAEAGRYVETRRGCPPVRGTPPRLPLSSADRRLPSRSGVRLSLSLRRPR